jgi:hypothetical protein
MNAKGRNLRCSFAHVSGRSMAAQNFPDLFLKPKGEIHVQKIIKSIVVLEVPCVDWDFT